MPEYKSKVISVTAMPFEGEVTDEFVEFLEGHYSWGPETEGARTIVVMSGDARFAVPLGGYVVRYGEGDYKPFTAEKFAETFEDA